MNENTTQLPSMNALIVFPPSLSKNRNCKGESSENTGSVSKKDTKNCIKNGRSRSMLLSMAVLAL